MRTFVSKHWTVNHISDGIDTKKAGSLVNFDICQPNQSVNTLGQWFGSVH